MAAIDTIACYQGTVNSTLAAGTFATGDSGTVRNFPQQASCYLAQTFYDDVTTPLAWRVRSPLLHDNVQGIRFNSTVSAPSRQFPGALNQQLQPQDQLTVELSTAASTGKALGVLELYYTQLPGAAARLYGPGDIIGNIDNIKPIYIAVGSGANTAGQWYDLVITTSEDLTHANTDYAVLGATFDQAVACIAVKGVDTGNLRVGIPGGTNDPFGPDFLWRLSEEMGMPCIPVINSANKGSTYVSIVSSAATGAAGTITLYLAELHQNLA